MRLISQICAAVMIFTSLCVSTQAQEKAGKTLLQALSEKLKSNKKAKSEPVPATPMPQNSISSPSNAITPTGGRLTPFGSPQYWGNTPPPQQNDGLVSLPPLPDLRTPDQVSKVETKRNKLNARFAARQAEAKAKAEANEKVVVEQRDPSSALIHVQSSRDYATDSGYRDRPSTATGSKLKPFNAGSSYTQNGQVLYQHNNTVFVEPATAPAAGEEMIATLPPLPDLRTPDQVSKLEKKRNKLNERFRERQLRELKQREGLGTAKLIQPVPIN